MTKKRAAPQPDATTELATLDARLTATRAETKRVSDRGLATKRKLVDLGKKLAHLETELAEINGSNGRAYDHSAKAAG